MAPCWRAEVSLVRWPSITANPVLSIESPANDGKTTSAANLAKSPKPGRTVHDENGLKEAREEIVGDDIRSRAIAGEFA
jgi:hypothetical protein